MELTGRDLAALVRALQPAVGGKVQKVYGTDRFALVLDLYARDLPYRYLYIELPSLVFMHAVKVEMPERPKGLAQRVRGQLQGLRIAAVEQHARDRILIFRLDGRKPMTLIVELFGKGNIVVLDEQGIMRNVLSKESYGSRNVKPGAEYVFPSASGLSLDHDGFVSSLDPAKHLVAQIAGAGFGGQLAEGILRPLVGNVATATLADLADPEELRVRLVETWAADRFSLEADRLIADPDGVPILESLAAAVDLQPAQDASDAPRAERASKSEKVIEIQTKRLESLADRRAEDLHRGELLFANYPLIEEILVFCREYRAEHGSLAGLDEAWPDRFPKLVSHEKKGIKVSIELPDDA